MDNKVSLFKPQANILEKLVKACKTKMLFFNENAFIKMIK